MTTFAPTQEQLAALEAYATGEDLIIEAGAGTGKTATLKLLAESDSTRRGQYIAFNRAIVTEAQERMPGHVKASTAHSLAFRALGHRYSHRLNGRRMRSDEIAIRLRIDPIVIKVGDHQKTLAAGYLAGLVMRTITQFCQSAADTPGEQHVPYIEGIDMPSEDGARGWANNRMVRNAILPYVLRAWLDLQRTDGQLTYKHEHYLKAWQLAGPHICADVVFFDEAQDVSPVLAAIVAAQTHAQRVYVWATRTRPSTRGSAQSTPSRSSARRAGPRSPRASGSAMRWPTSPTACLSPCRPTCASAERRASRAW